MRLGFRYAGEMMFLRTENTSMDDAEGESQQDQGRYGRSRLCSVQPVARSAVQVHHGNDLNAVRPGPVYHRIGKAKDPAETDVTVDGSIQHRAFPDLSERRPDRGGKASAEAGALGFVIPG